MTAKEWVFPAERCDKEQIQKLCRTFGIPPIVARVMINRGYGSVDSARQFLDKNRNSFHDPFLMTDMDKAAAKIKAAVSEGTKITVYGDYDVDGITSAALMVRALREMGADAEAYIPDRRTEGYGVNKGALDKIAARGTGLIITVDTGITAVDEAEYASELGMEMIITDHHECKEKLPSASAVVNPKRPDCKYPFKELAGVGVAFKVICALTGDLKSVLEKYGDIIALGTIADVVSLTDENRAIADFGIGKMRLSPNIGLKAVMDIAGASAKRNSCAVVSYSIAPRLNAAGRMSSAMSAVELLLTEDEAEAEKAAAALDEENRLRQSKESVIFDEAAEMIQNGDFFGKKVLVLAKRGWHHGIIGVVASRICDKFNKSCILISVEDDMCKSSGRSVEGLNLFDALSSCADILEKFGGHAYAAGFSIKKENISELDRRLNEYAERVCPTQALPKLYIDTTARIDEITLENAEAAEALCPCGAGNKTPVFALRDVVISDIRLLSGGRHCRIAAEKDRRKIEVIAFGMGSIAREYAPGDEVDLAGEMNINVYNGIRRVQLVLADIRISRRLLGRGLPDREDFADIYRFIKALPRPFTAETTALSEAVSRRCGRNIRREKLVNALNVFADVGILSMNALGDTVRVELTPNMEGKKFNLAQSGEYIRLRNELGNGDDSYAARDGNL